MVDLEGIERHFKTSKTIFFVDHIIQKAEEEARFM